MRSDLIITRIPTHTEEWFQFRKNGIGGSEVGDLLLPSEDRYDSPIWMFHYKVGTIHYKKEENEYMFWGREHEDNIADKWRYWDGRPTGYIENYKEGKIIRECRNINGFIVNPKYPWMFASVDRVMNVKGGRNLITGEPLKTEGVLECKNLNYWAAQKWTDKMPYYYLLQVHHYMIILETDYAELAILMDGNKLRVEYINRDESLCERIIDGTKGFWYNRIIPAKAAFEKKCIAEREGNLLEAEKMEAEIQKYEPYPDDSKSYAQFMNERFLKSREEIEGTMELYDLCKRDKVLSGIGKIADQKRVGIQNIMINLLTKEGAEAINFGKLGYFSWGERKGSKNRVPLNNIKEKPEEGILMEEFDKINLDCY